MLLWKTNQTVVNSAKFTKIMEMIDFYNQMPSNNISSLDKFGMPVIDVDYKRDYQQLKNLAFSNKDFENYVIG